MIDKIQYDYAPDGWILIQITGDEPHYRVFGAWRGGFSDGDAWRVNSGITKMERVGNYYYFYGHSGSVYCCHEEGYGSLGAYNYGVLTKMEETEGFQAVPFLPDNIEELINANPA